MSLSVFSGSASADEAPQAPYCDIKQYTTDALTPVAIDLTCEGIPAAVVTAPNGGTVTDNKWTPPKKVGSYTLQYQAPGSNAQIMILDVEKVKPKYTISIVKKKNIVQLKTNVSSDYGDLPRIHIIERYVASRKTWVGVVTPITNKRLLALPSKIKGRYRVRISGLSKSYEWIDHTKGSNTVFYVVK